MGEMIRVAGRDEIPVNGRKIVEINMTVVAIFNLNGEFFAIEDRCTHDDGPLAEGELVNGCQLRCPRHGARFDIRTGEALSMPAYEPTRTFAVQLNGDDIFVEEPA